jgi:uncharacterized YkwD family protein
MKLNAICPLLALNATIFIADRKDKSMKKIPAILCSIMLLPTIASAENDITVFVNSNELTFDQPPIIYNDRTLVPMRAIFETLGLTVQWFDTDQRITAFDDDVNITMYIGEESLYVNGDEILTDVAPMIVNDRTLVPLRAIAETLGCNVEWYPESRTVTIDKASDGNADDDNSAEAWEHKVLELTNAEREKNGLDPLVWNESLAELARAHSQDMVDRGFFSHNNPDGASPFDRMKAAGINYISAAENIAAGQASPEAVIESWMNSEGHRENILNPKLKELGVGLARGGQYGIYWTQNFATFK